MLKHNGMASIKKKTTPCYKPEGHNLKFHHHENLTYFYLVKLMHTNKSLEEES